ncbi:MAG: ATP synthase F0 subunit C [Deltaproteobacteria bacterium]|nr:ATP synthase F0 subunit C [Deltaproteobacteria bacterium]MBI3293723.1 ATP synthase F0 subunit C [Deltaproteobacteria bacterium]
MKVSISKGWWTIVGLLTAMPLLAEEHGAAAATGGSNWSTAFAVGIGMALAVVAAATAQGKIGASYMDGVSRNPGAQKAMGTQLILSLVFVETLVLFTFAIVFLLMGKM